MACTGVVLSFGGAKGYGFIASEEVAGDVFFGRAALQPDLKDAAGEFFPLKGKSVQFELKEQQSEGGKPQASSVRLVAADGEALMGQVKSFNAAKGFGFLGSSALEGQDFFFSKRDVPPQFHTSALQGATASFVVAQAPDGKLQAKQLNIRGPQAAMPMAMMAPAVAGPGRMAWAAGDGQRMRGTVHSYNVERGFGFIKCPQVPADLYFKGQGMDHQQGEHLAFTLKVMPDGKLQARDVCAGFTDGRSYTATVSSYSSKNGYGFLTVPDGHGDVYFKKDIVPVQLQEMEIKGKHARVLVQLTQDGKPQAVRAQFMDSPPPGYVPPAPSAGGAKRSAPVWPNAAGSGIRAVQPQMMQMQLQPQPQKRARVDHGLVSCHGAAAMGAGAQATGVIASYNPAKGFGFIKSPVSAADVFFGRTSMPAFLLQHNLQGRACAFELVFSPEGKPQAQNLQVAG